MDVYIYISVIIAITTILALIISPKLRVTVGIGKTAINMNKSSNEEPSGKLNKLKVSGDQNKVKQDINSFPVSKKSNNIIISGNKNDINQDVTYN